MPYQSANGHRRIKQPGPMNTNFEDKFIDGVLETMAARQGSAAGSTRKGAGRPMSEQQRLEAEEAWGRFSEAQHQAGQQVGGGGDLGWLVMDREGWRQHVVVQGRGIGR